MTTLSKIIADEIVSRGWIPFSRFMELALYCPEYGYYEAEKDRIGRKGDFFTSVSTGELFGKLLGWRFAKWLEALPPADTRVQVVECGGHDGRLAADVLRELHHSAVVDRLEYWLLEPSPRRRGWQQETLREFSGLVRWAGDWQELAAQTSVRGVIYANELLDAMPLRQFRWDRATQRWYERGVTVREEAFAWGDRLWEGDPPSVELTAALREALPDGYILEVSEAARNWWRQASQVLAAGRLLTLDYGFEDLLVAERSTGTVRAYQRHTVSQEVLKAPGEQDLTAHVDFGAIERVGLCAGLSTEVMTTQSRFLSGILAEKVASGALTTLDAQHLRQFQALTHPGFLGSAFKALVQKKL